MSMKRSAKDKYFVYDFEHKCWMHRTPLKCFVNPILRKLQFWTDKPFVIYSKVEWDNDIVSKSERKPRFVGYGFGRINYFKNKRISKDHLFYPWDK